MKKKLYSMIVILVTVFFVSSVIKAYNKTVSVSQVSNNQSNYAEVTKMLLNIKTFAMSGTVTYITNEEKNTYKMLQYGKSDGTYRVEFVEEDGSKNTTIFDTKTILQYNDDMNGVVNISTNENTERSEIFITKFIKNYENSKDVSVLVSNINDASCTVLEANIPGNNSYYNLEKLFIDNKTLLPIKLVIYDDDNLERIVVNYDQFIVNPTLDEEIFSVNSN